MKEYISDPHYDAALAFNLLSAVRISDPDISEVKFRMADEDNSTGTNMIWAVAMIIIVAIIAGALYYSGFLGRRTPATQKIDVEVNASVPAR